METRRRPIQEGNEPQSKSEDQIEKVLGIIMGWYNEIATCFDSDPERFERIFWEGQRAK